MSEGCKLKHLTGILLGGMIMVSGCSDTNSLHIGQSMEHQIEIFSTENKITELYFHMRYGRIKICPVSESDHKLPENEIRIETDRGKNVPELMVNEEHNAITIEENEKLKPQDAAGYQLYVYLPEDRVYDVIEIVNENSYVDLTGYLTVKKMLVDLNVAADVNIIDAAINELDIHTTIGKVNIQLKGDPLAYDYNLYSDHGSITLNGVRKDEGTTEILKENNGDQSVSVYASGNIFIQIDQ